MPFLFAGAVLVGLAQAFPVMLDFPPEEKLEDFPFFQEKAVHFAVQRTECAPAAPFPFLAEGVKGGIFHVPGRQEQRPTRPGPVVEAIDQRGALLQVQHLHQTETDMNLITTLTDKVITSFKKVMQDIKKCNKERILNNS